MKVYPHPSKHRRYKGETWWLIDIGYDEKRQRLPWKGTYESAVAYGRGLSAPENAHKTSSRPAIKELIVPFLDYYRNEAAPTTIRDFRFSIDLYFIPYFGNLRPGQLTPAIFDDFKKDLLKKGLSPTTINKHLNYLSSILKWATKNGDCEKLPFDIPKFSKKKTVAEPTKPLSPRQLDALYERVSPPYRLLFLLMSDMGLRQTEAMSVRVDDVDERNQVITVKGKGSKYRRVPFMSARFERELCKALDNRLEGYLVINPKTGTKYDNIWKEIKRSAKAAGLTRKVNHHILRHTFATICAERGMNAHALQKILGHSSIETTNKIYTHVSLDFVGDEARKIRAQEKKNDRVSYLRLVSSGNK